MLPWISGKLDIWSSDTTRKEVQATTRQLQSSEVSYRLKYNRTLK